MKAEDKQVLGELAVVLGVIALVAIALAYFCSGAG